MTSRERVLAAFEGRATDKPAFSWGLGVNPPVRRALGERLGLDEAGVEAWLLARSDVRQINLPYIGPADREIQIGETYRDLWGVERSPFVNVQDTFLEISHYPLAGAECAADVWAYDMPQAEWFDFSDLHRQLDEYADYAILARAGNPFECAWYMRGFEQIFYDMVDDPDIVEALMERVTQYFEAYLMALFAAAQGRPIDLAFTADDLGSQEGLITSLDMWERFIKPYHVRLNAIIHKNNCRVLYHSDGAVARALPGLIDAGIDILEAVQTDARGMEPEGLAAEFRGRLHFHGGVSVQKVLPYGTAEEVRREVRRLIENLGPCGYILAPSHAIQAGTPVDNVLAMLEEAGRLDAW